MAEYWSKRLELPEASTSTTAVSSDEEEADDNDDEDDDDDQVDGASSIVAPSSPAKVPADDSDTEMESPDDAFARFRAQKAALVRKSGFTEWDAELRSWTRRISEDHSANMDLCEYWQVRRLSPM